MLFKFCKHGRSLGIADFIAILICFITHGKTFVVNESAYDIVRNCIEQLSFGNIKPINDGREKFTAENVLRFIDGYGSAYPVEIATAFGLARRNGHTALNVESYEGLPDMLDGLITSGAVATMPRGNGFICYNLNGKHPKPHVHGHEYAGAVS